MIINYEDLPLYTSPFRTESIKDSERLKQELSRIDLLRNSITDQDIKKLKSFVRTEILTEEERKLDEFRKKIHNIYTQQIELSYVFTFCVERIRTLSIQASQNVRVKFDSYTDSFTDLKRLTDILNVISKKPSNKDKYEDMLSALISPYTQKMMEFIELAQEITRAFSSVQEGLNMGSMIQDLKEAINPEKKTEEIIVKKEEPEKVTYYELDDFKDIVITKRMM